MDLEQITRFRTERNAFGKHLSIAVEELRPGYARTGKTVTAEDLNPLRVAHGGVYYTMADIAAGNAMAAHGYAAVTVNASFSYFRSAVEGDRLTAEATEIKSGKTICVFDVQVRDQTGALLAAGTFTFFRMEQPLDLA